MVGTLLSGVARVHHHDGFKAAWQVCGSGNRCMGMMPAPGHRLHHMLLLKACSPHPEYPTLMR